MAWAYFTLCIRKQNVRSVFAWRAACLSKECSKTRRGASNDLDSAPDSVPDGLMVRNMGPRLHVDIRSYKVNKQPRCSHLGELHSRGLQCAGNGHAQCQVRIPECPRVRCVKMSYHGVLTIVTIARLRIWGPIGMAGCGLFGSLWDVASNCKWSCTRLVVQR
jgi:hypothetical protein